MVPLDVARTAFGLEGVSRVDIGIAAGARAADVTDALAARLTTEPYVLVVAGRPRRRPARLDGRTSRRSTALIAAIVLFVGSFLIVNTLSMTVGERAREVGLLRAAGATRAADRAGSCSPVRWLSASSGSALGLGVGLLLGSLSWPARSAR